MIRALATGLAGTLLFAACSAPRDAAAPGAPDVTLLLVDTLETADVEALDPERTWTPAHHWADRPLTLALPTIAVAADEAGYATRAIAGDEPPGVARELPFVFESLERAAETTDLEAALAVRTDRPRFLYAHVENVDDLDGLLDRVDRSLGRNHWWILTRERRPCGLEPGCDPLHPSRRSVPFAVRSPTVPSPDASDSVWTGHVDTARAMAEFFEAPGGRASGPLAGESSERLVFATGASTVMAAVPYYFLDDGEVPRIYDLSQAGPPNDRRAIE
ncbi:MAG: hypothetical protein OER88_13310, partial [Planctomycetota bacterium]|nr:hypothetical protein [Planctomycetota bacterium]